MTTIFEQVEDALDTLNVPYGMGTYLCNGVLPNQYMVYQMIDGVASQHADDLETQRIYRIQVDIYDRSGLVNLPDVDAAMLAAGFVKGPERQLDSENATDHFGLSKDYFKLC
jgi:hypothetical protein